MQLQTEIPLLSARFNQIDYSAKVLLLGSCFSDNIGAKFDYYKFQNLSNPFGVQFHPIAIETLITNAINEKFYTESDAFFHNEQWHCFDAHSKFSNASKAMLLNDLNAKIETANLFLGHSSHIIITLGTAWAYRFIETDTYVANCHKIPQRKFLKRLLSIDAISESLDAIVSLVKSINPSVSFIFTVSPIRHLKDGFVENTRSKAHLISAIHEFLGQKSSINEQLFYFPSYEIVMDELRDYRFYKQDMVHPNALTVDYIWEKFKSVWVSKDAERILDDVEMVQKSLAHRPYNPDSEAHQAFLDRLQKQMDVLKGIHQHITFP